MTNARPLDHLVIPVTDLKAARSRLTRLGFTVAAEARHPFGTENACVFLADKTYLEPLAVGDPDATGAIGPELRDAAGALELVAPEPAGGTSR